MKNMMPETDRDPAGPQSEGLFAPQPTPRTKALRTFVPWQIVRFILINIKMFEMISKSHE